MSTWPLRLNDMGYLKVLRLTQNELKVFHPALGQLHELEELVLDRNKLKAIEPNVFAPDNFPQL